MRGREKNGGGGGIRSWGRWWRLGEGGERALGRGEKEREEKKKKKMNDEEEEAQWSSE